jgi:hypothetical protein
MMQAFQQRALSAEESWCFPERSAKSQEAMEDVYGQTTLQNLIDNERTAAEQSGLLVQVV